MTGFSFAGNPSPDVFSFSCYSPGLHRYASIAGRLPMLVAGGSVVGKGVNDGLEAERQP